MLLRATDLAVRFGDTLVVAGVSLDLAAGEIVALVGPNGGGKSTLLRALLGHVKSAGAIAWQDRPLPQWRPRQLARAVGYLAQHPGWMPGQRVIDLLRLGRTPYTGPFGIESESDASAVTSVADRLGLTRWLTYPLDELSGGQRQRVLLARCLVQQPAALLLDEPDTHLDLGYQLELAKLLRRLAVKERLGILLVSHDLHWAAAVADRLMLLSQGKLIAGGTGAAVLSPDVLGAVYGVEFISVKDSDSDSTIVLPRFAVGVHQT